jgi:hypothetical protein
MKVLKIIGIIFLVLIFMLVILYYSFAGFTKKQRYYKCVAKCEEMLFIESNKRYCGPRCEEVAEYTPTAADKQGDVKKQEKPATTSSKTNVNTNTNKNIGVPKTDVSKTAEEEAKSVSENLNREDKEYYCEWVWPQKIIDRETGEIIVECPMGRPWCNYSDFKYENVGCCEERVHENCILLDELID